MLSQADNRVLTESGPDTPMGEVMRRFWLPVLLSQELRVPDGDPVHVDVLGEQLLAFRDSDGRIGLVDRRCPHRGADLYFGRNEDCGLRCVYHGWKFDVDGNCLDLPTAPPDSRMREKVRLTSYPTREVGGMIWAYLGPREDDLPEIPRHEFTLLPNEHVFVSKKWQECNWVQSLEGGIDTAHLSFLHMPAPNRDDRSDQEREVSRAALSDQAGDHRIRWVRDDPAPVFTVVPHPAGLLLGAARRADGEDIYWRTTQFLMPSTAYAPNAFPSETLHGQIWVPADDVSCWIYTFSWNPERPLTTDERAKFAGGFSVHAEVDDNYLPVRRLENNYLMDRDDQRRNSYTGIRGVSEQDAAIQNSQGPIVDRSREHLGATDVGIIEFRKLMLSTAKALGEGHEPPSARAADGYTVQCGGSVAHRDVPLAEVMQRRFGHEYGHVGDRYAG